MNKLTAANNPFYADELLSPVNQTKVDVRASNDGEQTPVILAWLYRVTNRSYETWLARGGLESSVE